MSRTGWSTSNFLRYDGAVVTTEPLTIAAWVLDPSKPGSSTNRILGIYNRASVANRDQWALLYNGAGNILARAADTVGQAQAQSGTAFADNVWAHACAVFASTTSRAAYLNGGSKGTNSTSKVVNAPDRTSFGLQDNAGSTKEAPSSDVLIAEAGIWNVALADAEVAALALGVQPFMVRPSALVAYWPLIGFYSPEIELMGRQEMTIQGALSDAAHPRILWYPANARRASFHSNNPISADVNLIGVTATGVVGSLAEAISKSLAGAAGSGAVGPVAISILRALTGIAGTGQVGVITPRTLVMFAGTAGASVIGALVADTATRINLMGAQGTSSPGSMVAAAQFLLAGSGATGNVGKLAEEITFALIGVAAEVGIDDPTVADNWHRLRAATPTDWTAAPRGSHVWSPIAGGDAGWHPP